MKNGISGSTGSTRRQFMSATAFAAVSTAVAAQSDGAPAVLTGKQQEFDYIIVGAGSSGCVLANRLSAKADVSVLLLEAGGPDSDPLIHSFARFPELQGTKFDWMYETEKEPHLNDQRVNWPRGKVFGGSSSINAMIYIRGHRLDYDHWSYLGNEGWSYEDVLPLFKKSEHNEKIKDAFHGQGGELNVSAPPLINEIGSAFIEGASEIGLRGETDWDFNGAIQEGVAGCYQYTVKDGKRHSTAAAFLTPVLHERSNLDARPWSFVTRIRLEEGRARSVEYASVDGQMHHVRANREIILCAGAIDSPQLLMLSGIGPGDHLRQHGIAVNADLPGVGRNLQDHPVVWHEFESRVTAKGATPCGGLFVRSSSSSGAPSPNLQFHPYSYADASGRQLFGFNVTLVRPYSIGSITLANSDCRKAPRIQANYLESSQDIRALQEGIDLARQLAASKAMSPVLGGELDPFRGKKTHGEIAIAIRQELDTLYHPVGTCKMGHDAAAVVDPQLRVHGVEGLRVADASIMPAIVSGNTNAPCIMIAEKASALILG